MENTDRLLTYFERIPEGQILIFKFFITFARLECALKNSSRFLKGDNTFSAANWDKFITTLDNFDPNSTNDLRLATDYILNNPPKKQVIQDNQLIWIDSLVTQQSVVKQLNIYIRRIRNNLLHGGKFNGNYTPEVSKNYMLLKSAIIIMNYWINLDNEIKELFNTDVFEILT